ncbi:MAG: peptide-methionine (R)-S-oxide reductase MsrB [Caulobacterales bacterium]|jgi:peptide-methionine (R)-S-oxide reductase
MSEGTDEAAMRKIQKTDAEWKNLLSPEQFRVLRQEGTERAFTPGNLEGEKRKGKFICAGCKAADVETVLWLSENKFDSGTGWPSFWKPASPGIVATKTDWKLIYPRTECHCAVCNGHQGHVFDDGPPPTRQRWCINGVALHFIAM